jgi:hypothetical protein
VALEPVVLSTLAVILTVPKWFAVTLPLESTVAILSSLEVQVNVLPVIVAPLESLAIAVNAVASFSFKAFVLGPLTVMLETLGASGVAAGQAVKSATRTKATKANRTFFIHFLSSVHPKLGSSSIAVLRARVASWQVAIERVRVLR